MKTETAYAKINLALHVRRRRDDGYHELETLFAFCEDGDVLEGDKFTDDPDTCPGDAQSGGSRLTIVGPFAGDVGPVSTNSITKAYDWLAPQTGVRFRLTKRLPVASGIGGGSADAAAALRLVHRLWCDDARVFRFQTETASSEWRYAEVDFECRHASFDQAGHDLGADVPVCIHSQTARGEGIGEQLRLLGGALKGTPILLVNPRVAVSTREIFQRWDEVDRGPLRDGEDLLAIAQSARNDLTPMALQIAPVIATVLAVLEAQSGTTLVRMSGSGATCFALFVDDNSRDAAAASISSAHSDWWTLSSRLR
jgi:4-diphosphocytidyl-2-C-methyl-D-erythritol kinase